MKWVERLAIFAVLAIVASIGLQFLASEASGEVVVLTTSDDTGTTLETRLWIVDHNGEAWLRAGMDQAGWYNRILKNSSVTLVRNDRSASYTAVPVPVATASISSLIREKYGWGDALISWALGRKAAVAVRLDPTEP